MDAGQLIFFPLQTRDRVMGIAVQRSFTFGVAHQLLETPAQSFDHLTRAVFLFGQSITLHRQTLQHSRGDGLFFAFRRQNIFAGLACLSGQTHRRFRLRGRKHAAAQQLFGLQTSKVGFSPAAKQQQSFSAAQLGSNFAVAGGLTGLAAQGGQLRS